VDDPPEDEHPKDRHYLEHIANGDFTFVASAGSGIARNLSCFTGSPVL
jgi:hypothetical protein